MIHGGSIKGIREQVTASINQAHGLDGVGRTVRMKGEDKQEQAREADETIVSV